MGAKPLIFVGVDPSWQRHPDDTNVWVTPEGRVLKQINHKHPERRQWLEYTLETDKDGYKKVCIKGNKWIVHRLVYLLFVGVLLPNTVICHKDNNPSNNHWENLLQASQKVNMSHKRDHGTHQAGERHPHSKHTQQQVEAIRAALISANRSKSGRLRHCEAPRIAKEAGTNVQLVYDLSRVRGATAWQA